MLLKMYKSIDTNTLVSRNLAEMRLQHSTFGKII